MDKFSLYEFLSFFMPGLLACFLVYQFIPESYYLFKSIGELGDGLVLSALALVMGLIIHRISFLFLHHKWFQWLIYPSIETMLQNPLLGLSFERIRTRLEKSGKNANVLFDKAYYYLEAEDKIASSKGFQSMYFFLRNVFVLTICLLPWVIWMLLSQHPNWFVIVLAYLITLWTIRGLALFYRAKMIERVFYSYYAKKTKK